MNKISIFYLLFIYLIIELIYISLIANKYKSIVTNIQSGKRANFKLFPYGILSYFVLFLTFWYFFINDIKSLKNRFDVCIRATILGLAIYGVFDFTLLTLFDKYPLTIAIIDILYGIFIFNLLGQIAFYFK